MPPSDKNFVDWTHHVLEELVKLNAKYESLREDYHQLTDKFDTINKIISGNGSPEEGLSIRVALLAADSKRREVWAKAAIGGAVAALFSAAAVLLKLVYKP